MIIMNILPTRELRHRAVNPLPKVTQLGRGKAGIRTQGAQGGAFHSPLGLFSGQRSLIAEQFDSQHQAASGKLQGLGCWASEPGSRPGFLT